MKNTVFLILLAVTACGGNQTVIQPPGANTNPSDDAKGSVDAKSGAKDFGTHGPDLKAGEKVPDAKPQKCVPGSGRVGFSCQSDGDCETCFCYDEGYLGANKPGGFRFCTLACGSGPSGDCDLVSKDGDEYECVRFYKTHIDGYDLTVDSICMPTCQSVGECHIYSTQYTYCPAKGQGTKWEGKTVQIRSTCQTTNQE